MLIGLDTKIKLDPFSSDLLTLAYIYIGVYKCHLIAITLKTTAQLQTTKI